MKFQKTSNKNFKKLIQDKRKTLTEKSGRYKSDEGVEKKILKDIFKKISPIDKNKSFLDIGCGIGHLTNLNIQLCQKKKIELTLCDLKFIIDKLKKNYRNKKNLYFIGSEFQKQNFGKKKYDRIMIYSAIQYVDNPKKFLNKAFKLLNSKGKMLIGDVPNINKKFRFLTSKFGSKFEAKKRSSDELRILTKSLNSFIKNTKQNIHINDKFISWIKKNFKKLKCQVYLCKQPKELPFSFTRDDIIIKKLK